MTTKTRTKRTGLQKAMRELGARSFMDFLTMRWWDEELARERTLVQVTLPPDPTALDGGGGLIDFEMWEHLEEVIELVGTEKLLNFMKARQVGLTWVIAAYCLWLAMYHQASKVLIFSQGDKEAKAFLRRIHSIYDNLPDFMREPLATDNTSEMEFPTMSSRIEAVPSTEKAGRSETVSLIVQDEAEYHEHIDLNFAAMKPTIDSGGQVIQISRPGGKGAWRQLHPALGKSPGSRFAMLEALFGIISLMPALDSLFRLALLLGHEVILTATGYESNCQLKDLSSHRLVIEQY
ncbi:hypothetical protein LCGC14_3128050, partial [marine sediment metagenome]